MKNRTRTEVFVMDQLPAMVVAKPGAAMEAYVHFNGQLRTVMGDVSRPGVSSFDWRMLQEYTDAANGDRSQQRLAIAKAAADTEIRPLVYQGMTGYDTRIPVHTGLGTFLTVDERGLPRAFAHNLNPDVPEAYGCIDGIAIRKLSQAVLMEKLKRQGADWGEGYAELAAINRQLGIIGPTGRQTIGMATHHEIPYEDVAPGTDRHALAYTGTAGRTASHLLLAHLREFPSYTARMREVTDRADMLAGLLDTLSSTVANKALIEGVNQMTNVVELPDPNAIDNVDVNWN
jgi:hypothetical protein